MAKLDDTVPLAPSEGESTVTNTISTTLAAPAPRTGGATFTGPVEGRVLGSYRLEHRVGRGGMGEVFAARHVDTGERVALKWFAQSRAAGLHRFKREFRSLADVKHPNLVRLGELVVLPDSRAFFTMELLDAEPFHVYVRQSAKLGELPNLVRLRRALAQLVAGVSHLHMARRVHRDLKPSNVLVTRKEGRVVILDFGLVSLQAVGDMSISPAGVIVGTPSYISPEHAAYGPANEPSDLYAIGVMLYLCLSGKQPFHGTVREVLRDKCERDAPPITDHVHDVPPALAQLCSRLLARDPAERPSAPELLEFFDRDAARILSMTRSRAEPAALLPSRARLLAELEASFAASSARPVTVHLRHAASSDKHVVFDRFFAALESISEADLEPLMLLRGRCHERESVPYKGLDQLVDSLTLQLSSMAPTERDALAPDFADPLLKMFPVLGSVWHPVLLERMLDIDKSEMRSFAVAALRELLVRAGERYRVVVCLEDFHWADSDGAQLLSELVRPPEAPLLLMIVTYDEAASGGIIEQLRDPTRTRGRDIREHTLGPLDLEESTQLARAYLDEAFADMAEREREQRIPRYIAHAHGDPMLLAQLVAAEVAQEVGGDVDDLILRRVFSLPEQERRVLALLSACESPGNVRPLLRSNELDIRAQLDSLVELKLVRRVGPDEFEPGHARVREAALSELDRPGLQEMHLQLAELLSASEEPPHESIAKHFVACGQPERAAPHFEQAGDHAASALAFARAIKLYEQALARASAPREPQAMRALERKLAEQYLHASRSREAIELYERLSQDAEPRELRTYQRIITELHIKAGEVKKGLLHIAPVLEEIGERLPQTRWKVLAKLYWRRLLLFLRGKRYVLREAETIDPRRLERLDVLHAIWASLTHQETMLAALVHARYFRLALATGEAKRLSRGFNYESMIAFSRGNDELARAHLATARELADSENPAATAVIDYAEYTQLSFRHEWGEAARRWPEMIDKLEGVPGAQYIRVVAASRYAYVLLALGRFRELDARASKWLLMTEELGHRREDAMICAMVAYAQLFIIQGVEATATRTQMRRARLWLAPNYSFTNFHMDLTEVARLQMSGDVDAALRLAESAIVDAQRWGVMSFEIVKMQLTELRARSLVMHMAAQPAAGVSVGSIRADIEVLRGGERVMYVGQAVTLEGCLAWLEGDLQGARAQWARASELFDSAGMRAHLAALQVRRAQLAHGEEATELRERAQVYFEAEQLDTEAQQRLVQLLVPGPAAAQPALSSTPD